MSEIELAGVGVDYSSFGRTVTAIDSIDLKVASGNAVAVIGPSGCGKSTLLYALSGLVAPTRGAMKIDGQPLVGQRRETALILQDFGLFPWNTVFDNAALGLRVRHVSRQQLNERAKQVLVGLGLWEMRDRYPGQLSGGQRQRVAIARSLALEPDLLLMDEPFSSLDALTREELQNTILDVWHSRGGGANRPRGHTETPTMGATGNGSTVATKPLTIIIVTHNIEEAAFLGQQIVVMGMGRIKAIVENKAMGDIDYRNSIEFYDHCARLRELLRGEKGGVPVG